MSGSRWAASHTFWSEHTVDALLVQNKQDFWVGADALATQRHQLTDTGLQFRARFSEENRVFATLLQPDGAAQALLENGEIFTVREAAPPSSRAFLEASSGDFSPTGLAAIGGYEGRLTVLQNGATLWSVDAHDGEIGACAISSDNQLVLSAGYVALKLWQIGASEPLLELSGHLDLINDCAVSADGALLVSCSCDGTARVWSGRSGETLQILREDAGEGLASCAFTPDGKAVVGGTWQGRLLLWDASSGQVLWRSQAHTLPVMDVLISSDGTEIVSLSLDGTVQISDRDTGAPLRMLPTIDEDHPYKGSLTPDGRRLLVGTYSGALLEAQLHRWSLAELFPDSDVPLRTVIQATWRQAQVFGTPLPQSHDIPQLMPLGRE